MPGEIQVNLVSNGSSIESPEVTTRARKCRQMLVNKKVLGVALLAFGFALSAQAGPAMFQASFIMHAWGNDITSGATYPYNEYGFTAAPVGRDCQSASPYTPNGATAPRYCSPALVQQGYPATGSGTLISGGATVGGPVVLPQSAFVADGITGFIVTYYPYLQSWTYATFAAEAGTFFAGGGPAAAGTVVKTGMGQTTGSWYIRPGANALGGVLGILGRYGAVVKYVVSGKQGTYEGTGSWGMVPEMGRPQFSTPIGYTAMGKTLWANPYLATNTYTNNVNGNLSALVAQGTGSPWTTGTVSAFAQAGVFQTILKRSGYDTVTAGGVRNIQLVTPTLTHWIGPGFQTHTAQIGILTLQITPEPEALLLLAAGGGLLVLLYWARRRA
jgi:hypothetical protein